MKRIIFTLLFTPIFLLTAVHPTIAQQAEKTLVKTFNLKGLSHVLMELEGDVQVTTWNQDILQVQMTIELTNGAKTILKSLVTNGRYNLESEQTDDWVTITAPGLKRQVRLSNGIELQEAIHYLVFAPENVLISIKNSGAEIGMADEKNEAF